MHAYFKTFSFTINELLIFQKTNISFAARCQAYLQSPQQQVFLHKVQRTIMFLPNKPEKCQILFLSFKSENFINFGQAVFFFYMKITCLED